MDGLIALALAKKYTDSVGQSIISAGFRVQVEQDRSILETTGEEKVLYLLPKASSNLSSDDGYDEFVYANNNWEWVGKTDVDLDYELLSNKPSVAGYQNRTNHLVSFPLREILKLKKGLDIYHEVDQYEQDIINVSISPNYFDAKKLDYYDFNNIANGFGLGGNGIAKLSDVLHVSNFPSALNGLNRNSIFVTQFGNLDWGDITYIRKVIGCTSSGDYKEYAQIFKTANGGGEIVSQTAWQELTGSGSQIVSGVVNANGTITFTDSEGNTFTTTGSSVIGPQGDDYILTTQDKADIADIVLSELPTTQGVLYGNTSN